MDMKEIYKEKQGVINVILGVTSRQDVIIQRYTVNFKDTDSIVEPVVRTCFPFYKSFFQLDIYIKYLFCMYVYFTVKSFWKFIKVTFKLFVSVW